MPHNLNSGTFIWEGDGVCDGMVRLDSGWYGTVLFPQGRLPLTGRCAPSDYKYRDISSGLTPSSAQVFLQGTCQGVPLKKIGRAHV